MPDFEAARRCVAVANTYLLPVLFLVAIISNIIRLVSFIFFVKRRQYLTTSVFCWFFKLCVFNGKKYCTPFSVRL